MIETEKEIMEGFFMSISKGGMVAFKCSHDDKKQEGFSLCPECQEFVFSILPLIKQLADDHY